MTDSQSKAWEMLTELERNSLYLTLSNGLSSWEAGEILKITHYKYLEIKERAEYFFKLFTDFWEKSESLYDSNTPLDESTKLWIEAAIQLRKPYMECIDYMGVAALRVKDTREKSIFRNMVRLGKRKEPKNIVLYNLIMEFDRWNNFRILPRELQMPSAFKRRNNKRAKIYIKYLRTMLPSIKEYLITTCYQRQINSNKKRYYMALCGNEYDTGYKVFPLRVCEETLRITNNQYIYIFKDKNIADRLGLLLAQYCNKTSDSTLGQSFWPEYREVIEQAINYKEVNNIRFVENLSQAYSNTHKSPKNKNLTKKGAKRLSESEIV